MLLKSSLHTFFQCVIVTASSNSCCLYINKKKTAIKFYPLLGITKLSTYYII